MGRHEFEPGKLVVGLVLIGGCLAHLAAVRGWVHLPVYFLLPVLAGGFCAAGLVSSLAFTVRRHRARGTEQHELQ
ncbi:hypothetical protein LKL35_25720 [Streptomyces sp. ET3-23]|uniref:hypothetical protein n=1 Tax=Streptomyces sp. ET3-23 TaxID=2885643 RepID=UPI001D101ED2|nr:hypothetical protein [Streptomyces sp. ET3-23]MCC2278801.1 hypothetical protein [Streptomyces sp. ET3-23]